MEVASLGQATPVSSTHSIQRATGGGRRESLSFPVKQLPETQLDLLCVAGLDDRLASLLEGVLLERRAQLVGETVDRAAELLGELAADARGVLHLELVVGEL